MSFPVVQSREAALVHAAAWLAALAVLAAWRWQAPDQAPAQALGAALLALCAFVAWRGVRAACDGTLDWDGQGWTWTTRAGGEPVQPRVTIDLQRFLLVRLDASGGRTRAWLWLRAARQHPGRWADLRRALLAPGLPADRASAKT